MLIAIPSKGRAGKTKSNIILPNATFFVPKSEEHQYKLFVKNIVAVPNDIQGITKTRNWILKNSQDGEVVFVDDDVRNAGYNLLEERQTKKIKLVDESFWLREFELYFNLCKQMGYKIWGVKTESAPRSNYPTLPFRTQTYVTASCMGVVNDGEYYFDESFKVKEDYEICLRHIRDKGGILGIRYLHWENDHWEQKGGCKDYRTYDIEKDAIKRLIKMYPGMVKSAKRKANEFTIQLYF